MELAIAPYAAGDEEGIIALILSIQQEEYGIAITAEDQPDLADITGFYQWGAGQFWTAKLDGRIIGTIALRDIGGGAGALRKMFVAKAHRGTGLGVAKALLGILLDWSRAAGLSRLYLGSTERFVSAHRFYERNGFRAVEAEALPLSFPRMAVDNRFYAIDLEPTGSTTPPSPQPG